MFIRDEKRLKKKKTCYIQKRVCKFVSHKYLQNEAARAVTDLYAVQKTTNYIYSFMVLIPLTHTHTDTNMNHAKINIKYII